MAVVEFTIGEGVVSPEEVTGSSVCSRKLEVPVFLHDNEGIQRVRLLRCSLPVQEVSYECGFYSLHDLLLSETEEIVLLEGTQYVKK